jgi:hypothetical protein
VKFVVDPDGQRDLDFMVSTMRRMEMQHRNWRFLVSPLDARGEHIPAIVEHIRRSCPEMLCQVIFSVQLHKLLALP